MGTTEDDECSGKRSCRAHREAARPRDTAIVEEPEPEQLQLSCSVQLSCLVQLPSHSLDTLNVLFCGWMPSNAIYGSPKPWTL